MYRAFYIEDRYFQNIFVVDPTITALKTSIMLCLAWMISWLSLSFWCEIYSLLFILGQGIESLTISSGGHMCPGTLNTGLSTDSEWPVGLTGDQFLPHSIPGSYWWKSVFLHSCCWETSSLLTTVCFSFASTFCLFASLPHIPSAPVFIMFLGQETALLCTEANSFFACLGLCGGGIRSSEHPWKRGGRGCTQAARLLPSSDLPCNVDTLGSSRNETTVSNVSAIPSTQAECLRHHQSMPEILTLKSVRIASEIEASAYIQRFWDPMLDRCWESIMQNWPGRKAGAGNSRPSVLC